MPREPQTDPLRKRKRGKVFTAADSIPIQARIPNAMFVEIERAARHELVSIADFVRAALVEKLKTGARQKLKPNNKSLFDCSLMRIQLNNQSSSGEAGRGGNSQLEDVRLLRPRHFLDGAAALRALAE